MSNLVKADIGDIPSVVGIGQHIRGEYGNTAEKYTDYFVEGELTGLEKREVEAPVMVNQFYDLVTDFYEYGWGQSFHFATRHKEESFHESIVRHENYLALKLGLKEGQRVLDAGCGVGGPLRNIALFSGAAITGLTINEGQVKRANEKIRRLDLDKQGCKAMQGNFMEDIISQVRAKEGASTPLFDHAFAVEATCHAGDKTKCFKNIYNALKPGGRFACYEWVTTPKYDPNDPAQVKVMRKIEEGDALPELATQAECVAAMKAAGFEVIEAHDVALDSQIGWEVPLTGGDGLLSAFRASGTGRFFTHMFVSVAEMLWLAPKGTRKISKLLNETADALAIGGETGTFSPMFMMVGQKPLK